MARNELSVSHYIGNLNPVQKLQPVHAIAAERQYFEGLANEVPDTELEAKFVFKEGIKPLEVLEDLMDYFSSDESSFTLFVPRILSTTNIVDKYSYSDGNFSVIYREDGTTMLKRKLGKDKKDGVFVRNERKIELENGSNFLEAVSDQFGITHEEISYLGRLQREKSRIVLSDQTSGRVYTLVIDATTVVGGSEQGKEKPTLQQMEIEYKGTDTSHNFFQSSFQDENVIDSIASDILQISHEVSNHLDARGLPVRKTGQTKTKWLKKQKRMGSI